MKADRSAGKAHAGKYVAYYRVSTDRQGKSGLGLSAQRESVMAYLNGGDWILSGEFVEVESGTKTTRRRPELAKALELCRKEKATLVVAKLDRLYRNLHAMTTLMQAGVEFVAADNPHANKLTIHMLAAIAEHERDLISERTTSALKAAKRRGVKLGSPDPKKGSRVGVRVLRQQADDYAAKVLPIVHELMRHGYTSLRDIAHGLSMRGVETPRGRRDWHPSQVSNLLKRER
jgi:DNA invertase Pin-like site-specific DNA recombinase